MDWLNIILTSISMSVDAMTVGAVDGVEEEGMKKGKMLLIAFSFGLFQFIMPVIGYFIGYTFREQAKKWIPYIAFSLLAGLAIKSFLDWLKDFREEKKKGALSEEEREAKENAKKKKLSFWEIIVQDIATSIDAFCIGFVFMSYSIPDAMIVFIVIGVTTFALSFLTIFLGSKVADKLEKWGGLLAAVAFLGIGIKILLEGIL